MIFTVTFKNPDALYENVTNGELKERKEIFLKFLAWGEMVRVEFDTEKGTAKVIENA